MAKKGKKTGVSFITSIICLVLSVLLVTTFFMPTYTEGAEDNKVAYNGVVLTQAMFMDEDDAKEAATNSINVLKYDEAEREEFAKLVSAYNYANDEENAGFKTSIIFNWVVLLAGVAGIVFSILALLNKGNSLGLIISALVGVVVTVVLVILTTSYAGYVYDKVVIKDLATLAAGAGVWVALASSVLSLGSAVAGKFLKK